VTEINKKELKEEDIRDLYISPTIKDAQTTLVQLADLIVKKTNVPD